MQGLSAPNPKQLPATAQREVSKRTIDCVENASSVETTKIILERVNRHGRSSGSLPNGTVLVVSSRQPFLDAARVLIAAGYHPASWVEGWRPGASAFALRARLEIAAGLTVDETRTVFAAWKPFSPSAVSSSIRYSEETATALPLAPSALLRSPPEQQSKKSAETELGAARPASSVADECTDRIPANFNNGSDDNRTALLAVAKEATSEAQVAKVGAISSAKIAAKATKWSPPMRLPTWSAQLIASLNFAALQAAYDEAYR